MTLTLEIISTPGPMPSARRREFREAGGRIGRDKSNDWVLPHNKVSSRHAVISYRNGTFYLEDRSRNGVFLNSTTNRLAPGKLQALQSGDCLFIEPYEIQVSIATDADARSLEADLGDFGRDPFAPARVQAPIIPNAFAPGERVAIDEASGEVDPLKLLGGPGGAPASVPNPAQGRRVLTADELDRRDPMAGHYQAPPIAYEPPRPSPPPEVRPPDPVLIPADYDPLADRLAPEVPMPAPPPAAIDDPFAPPSEPPVFETPRPEEPPSVRRLPPPPPSPSSGRVPVAQPPADPPPVTPVPDRGSSGRVDAARPSDLQAGLSVVLAQAGLGNVTVTPELAENFGQILRVVVGGVMDLLRARQQVKNELRMHQTQFQPSDNNPLKFSANIDDALHNLLVKRNPAYLGPVEAFGDAFEDLRDHQLAMLAGLRVAFEAILTEFDPDRLEEQFNRLTSRGSLLALPAKMRHWESYREKTLLLLKDVDATFRKWFGEEFVKAYEEQLERLEAERRQRTP